MHGNSGLLISDIPASMLLTKVQPVALLLGVHPKAHDFPSAAVHKSACRE